MHLSPLKEGSRFQFPTTAWISRLDLISHILHCLLSLRERELAIGQCRFVDTRMVRTTPVQAVDNAALAIITAIGPPTQHADIDIDIDML